MDGLELFLLGILVGIFLPQGMAKIIIWLKKMELSLSGHSDNKGVEKE